ncbi:unnamed protein product [Nesidiocoris tenuis]|uniref:Uncharacterized protein n=1 Tax=Nesidiocoris tenuis TaxID=355587 RepID=A0A6H5FY33_9HEMI|nr:unnamed protein product [Nesidiocoris tenuis]
MKNRQNKKKRLNNCDIQGFERETLGSIPRQDQASRLGPIQRPTGFWYLFHRYIAVFQHLIPLMVRKKEFKAGELRKSNGLIWKDALFIMKDKSVIIVEDHFTSNIELERMMIEPPTRAEAEIKKRRSRMI